MRWAPLLAICGCSQVLGLEAPTKRDAGVDAADARAVDVRIPVGTCKEKWHQGPVFAAPQPVVSLNTGSYESDPFVTADGLLLYYQHNFDVYYATRASTAQAFGTGMVAATLSSPENET